MCSITLLESKLEVLHKPELVSLHLSACVRNITLIQYLFTRSGDVIDTQIRKKEKKKMPQLRNLLITGVGMTE